MRDGIHSKIDATNVTSKFFIVTGIRADFVVQKAVEARALLAPSAIHADLSLSDDHFSRLSRAVHKNRTRIVDNPRAKSYRA